MELRNKTITSSCGKLRGCSYPITARMDETLVPGFYLKRVYIRYGDAEIVFMYPQWGALGATRCRRYGLSFKQKWFSMARHIDNITLMPFTCLPRESMPIFLGVIITKQHSRQHSVRKKKRSAWRNLIMTNICCEWMRTPLTHNRRIGDLTIDLWRMRRYTS